jgi:hypothetical protein
LVKFLESSQPAERRVGHRLVVTGQIGSGIDGLNLDPELARVPAAGHVDVPALGLRDVIGIVEIELLDLQVRQGPDPQLFAAAPRPAVKIYAVAMTSWPFLAMPMAAASPKPEPAPVMRMVLATSVPPLL